MKNNFQGPLAAILASFVFVACTQNKGAELKGPPPIPVLAQEVKTGNAVYFDTYPATITALNQVDIRPVVSGYITGIFFKDGQHVRKGTKLYEIDQQQYKAAYDQALANLNVARSNLAKAQEDANRYRDLAKHDAVARQTLEHAMADLKSARMQVEAARANVKSVQTNLQYSVIDAPFDGTIGISQVKLGSAVSSGQTLLNTISSDDPIDAQCAVDEKLIARFSTMLQNQPPESDSTFTLIMPDQSVYPFTGRLSVMDRSVDPLTGTIRIRVTFPNPGRVLRAGLTCDLRVRNTVPPGSILIPYKAVMEQMGEYFVFIVNGHAVSQQRVTLGMTIGDRVVIRDGLRQGELIVTDGIQKLRDKAVVAVAMNDANTAAHPTH